MFTSPCPRRSDRRTSPTANRSLQGRREPLLPIGARIQHVSDSGELQVVLLQLIAGNSFLLAMTAIKDDLETRNFQIII